ncbi:hypothetical protein [Saccharicrinis fermentans]|uniref:Uncharacterized protein n=1 Tax=Saccharicrinis fermentans DSM 9555 = JCM 21142 TaxID=869213 RepID=W7YLH4_9BACT|nr:hypothetical protein [Saccharicrinis fermentans]GAF05421.1 hypothetical protein JCM21142_104155 [Saccharicrinis fermentans DSM 9555 = JCM 21142]
MTTFTFSSEHISGTMTTEAKLRVSECRIEFDTYKSAGDKARTKGEFGFDSLTKKLRQNSTDLEKLKKEYTPFNIAEEEYYVPWLSISQGQTVELSVDVKKNKDKGTLDLIEGNDGNEFTILTKDKNGNESKDLAAMKSISISCNATKQTPTQLRFKSGNNIIGGINVFHPKPKKVDLRLVMVTTKVNKDDNDDEKNAISNSFGISKYASSALTQKIKDDLQRAFNPALLDFNIVGNTIHEVNLANDFEKNWAKYFMDANLRVRRNPVSIRTELLSDLTDYKSNNLFRPFSEEEIKKTLDLEINHAGSLKMDLLQEEGNEDFLGIDHLLDRFSSYNWGYDAMDKKSITLFLTNFQCYIPAKTLTGDDTKAGINGCSKTGNNQALMFLGNNAEHLKIPVTPKTELPHELMHCLGLPHVFLQPKDNTYLPFHYFNKTSTDNYMDYGNTVKHTFHFQWEMMHLSKFSK